jgi:hypothetical protein
MHHLWYPLHSDDLDYMHDGVVLGMRGKRAAHTLGELTRVLHGTTTTPGPPDRWSKLQDSYVCRIGSELVYFKSTLRICVSLQLDQLALGKQCIAWCLLTRRLVQWTYDDDTIRCLQAAGRSIDSNILKFLRHACLGQWAVILQYTHVHAL